MNEALDPQNVIGRGGGPEAAGQALDIGHRPEDHGEAVKIIVVMVLAQPVVAGRAGVQVVLGAHPQAEDDAGGDRAVARRHHLDRRSQMGPDRLLDLGEARVVDEIGFVENHHVGALDLVGEHLFERVVVVERRVRRALGFDRGRIVGEVAGGHGGGVHHRDHTVDGDPAFDLRPVEGLDQRLGQGQAGGLDDDVLGRRGPLQQGLHGGQEFLGHGAADAPVGQLDDVLLAASLDAAAGQNLPVDAQVPELVDNERQPPPVGGLSQVADKAGLAGAQKARDNGGGDFHGRASSGEPSFKTKGRPAAMSTTRSAPAARSW